jgi:hypothetical protein
MARRVRDEPVGSEAPSWLSEFVLADWAEPVPQPNPLADLAGPERAVEIYARGRWASAKADWCRAEGIDQKRFGAMLREMRRAG